jgi:fructose-1,6-bisphosphatase/inositol monophosphatase family enzyme
MKLTFPYTGSLRAPFDLIAEAVLKAARYLDNANSSKADLKIEVKADQSLVMNLDLESQKLILATLGDSFPIVAEETPDSHALISTESSFFLVDPLDGTTSCKRFLGQQGGQVGFGPLVGLVSHHQLSVAAFYSVPHRKLFTAVKGQGCHMTSFGSDWSVLEECRNLHVAPCPDLSKAGMLFLVSGLGESHVVEHLRKVHAIENLYRFGGFANDSSRIAQDFEQIQLQFNVKPWDLSAVLLAAEAGCDVFCDPMERRVPLHEWRLEANNPVAVLPAGTHQHFFSLIDQMR